MPRKNNKNNKGKISTKAEKVTCTETLEENSRKPKTKSQWKGKSKSKCKSRKAPTSTTVQNQDTVSEINAVCDSMTLVIGCNPSTSIVHTDRLNASCKRIKTSNSENSSGSCSTLPLHTDTVTSNGRRKKKSKHRMHNERSQKKALVNDIQVPTSTSDHIDIPGFYYDKMKKKYFRILPGQSNVMSSVVTKDVLRSRQAEDKRKDALYRQETSIGHGPQPVRKSLNLINILHRYETDCVRQSCKHEFARCLASGLRPRAQQKVYDVDMLHSYNTLQHMTSMQPNESANSLLCIWSLKHIMGHRIHALQVNVSRSEASGSLELRVEPQGPAILHSLSQVTDICWAPLATHKNTILYTTMRHMGSGPSVALLRSLDCSGQADYVADEFSLGNGATWACAWNDVSAKFGVGMEKHAVLMDVQTRRLWELNTQGSDVVSQVFSRGRGNMLFSGTRSGLICGHDLRSVSTRCVMHVSHSSSVCHLKMMHDDMYLVASDFSGKINMWDLRMKAVVQEFVGDNEYSRIPFHLNEQETILCSAGQDCYTRLWCVKTGRLLRKLPLPYPACRDSIPSLRFLSDFSSHHSPGLLMGVRDELHFYSF